MFNGTVYRSLGANMNIGTRFCRGSGQDWYSLQKI